MRQIGWSAGTALALILMAHALAAAQEPCSRKPLRDPREDVQILDIKLTENEIVGKIKNRSFYRGTASGVTVWVSYYIGSRGGLIAQQCIQVGDLKEGEEREFRASPIPEAKGAGFFRTAVDVLEWK